MMNKKVSLLIIVLFVTTIIFGHHIGYGETTNSPILPKRYAKILGKGLDVDWAKTKKGIKYYNKKAVQDFKEIGLSHVRIRVKNDLTLPFLTHLDKVIDDCLEEGLIPILAYQADKFKKNPNQNTLNEVVKWWKTISERYKDKSYLLSFDIIIEVTDKLNKRPDILNELYEKVVKKIRKTNPKRIIFISPRVRSAPEYLKDLKIPSSANGYLMAEWHFYASGPSKTNPKKLWTTGTEIEKSIIRNKIKIALKWQKEMGIYTWVGAWMPGDYNKGNHYTIFEQIRFANFVACELDKAHIPFAVNSDTKFYSREKGIWKKEMLPVLNTILHPKCEVER